LIEQRERRCLVADFEHDRKLVSLPCGNDPDI